MATLLAIAETKALGRDELPEAFGLRFFRAEALEPSALPPLQSAPESEAWLRRIQEREWAQGPYGSDISETLLDAANYFHSRGDYRSAIVHWRRAVHLIRVNNGLYSQLQLPTLQRLLETYLALGDLESADEIQSYLYFLSGQNNPSGSPAHIAAIVTWVDWERQRWLREPDPDDPGDLLSLWHLLEQETREDEERRLTVDQLEPLVLAQLRTLYVIEISDFGLDRETELLIGRQYGAGMEPSVDRSQIQVLQEGAYARARQRLEALDERLAAEGHAGRRAALHRTLGDWHQWHGQTQRAAEAYLESWRLLDAAGQRELRAAWYGTPVELPGAAIFGDRRVPPEAAADSAVVLARFDVTERGRVRAIDTVPRDPEDKGRALRLYRMLRDTRFRPRLVGGEPVATPGLEREYRVY